MKNKRLFLQSTLLSLSIAGLSFLSGCQMNQQTPSSSLSSAVTAAANPDSVPVLRFKFHSFNALCFDTYGCKVVYAGLTVPNDASNKKRLSFAEWSGNEGENALKRAFGGHIDIKNFPAPAKVTWRSKDGTSHSAEIDIGKIFKDERIIHHLPLREFAFQDNPMASSDDPTIVLVVDDRTIKVYMLASINTNREQIPGNKYSYTKNELTLAYSQTF